MSQAVGISSPERDVFRIVFHWMTRRTELLFCNRKQCFGSRVVHRRLYPCIDGRPPFRSDRSIHYTGNIELCGTSGRQRDTHARSDERYDRYPLRRFLNDLRRESFCLTCLDRPLISELCNLGGKEHEWLVLEHFERNETAFCQVGRKRSRRCNAARRLRRGLWRSVKPSSRYKRYTSFLPTFQPSRFNSTRILR